MVQQVRASAAPVGETAVSNRFAEKKLFQASIVGEAGLSREGKAAMGIMGNINQIGIVTPNIEATIEEFKKIGLENWSDIFVNVPENFEDMVADGKPQEYASKCASNFDLNIELELIEPLDELSDWGRFLAKNGRKAGLHHLRVDFDSIDDVHAAGKELLLSGVYAGSGMAYEYFDFRDELGLVLEYFPVDRD